MWQKLLRLQTTVSFSYFPFICQPVVIACGNERDQKNRVIYGNHETPKLMKGNEIQKAFITFQTTMFVCQPSLVLYKEKILPLILE